MFSRVSLRFVGFRNIGMDLCGLDITHVFKR